MTDATRTVKRIVFAVGIGHHDSMKPIRLTSVLLLTLTACAPLPLYYKPGVSVARLQSDQTDCEVKALRDAPVAGQIRQRPPIFVPGEVFCDSAGNCYSTPGYWIDGGIYTVDVNAGLRDRVVAQCMASKGYSPVQIPPCPVSVTSNVPASQTQKLPPLSASSCAIRNPDGSWQIVNRG